MGLLSKMSVDRWMGGTLKTVTTTRAPAVAVPISRMYIKFGFYSTVGIITLNKKAHLDQRSHISQNKIYFERFQTVGCL